MSLMPGTLAVGVHGDGPLRVHVLHPEIAAEASLRRLERRLKAARGTV
jgi:multisubunit Na+/H+ antiporter MnhE subunit